MSRHPSPLARPSLPEKNTLAFLPHALCCAAAAPASASASAAVCRLLSTVCSPRVCAWHSNLGTITSRPVSHARACISARPRQSLATSAHTDRQLLLQTMATPPGSPPPGGATRPMSAMVRPNRSSSRLSISSKPGGSRASDEESKTAVKVGMYALHAIRWSTKPPTAPLVHLPPLPRTALLTTVPCSRTRTPAAQTRRSRI